VHDVERNRARGVDEYIDRPRSFSKTHAELLNRRLVLEVDIRKLNSIRRTQRTTQLFQAFSAANNKVESHSMRRQPPSYGLADGTSRACNDRSPVDEG
jgi:hypothetical protein